MKRLAIIAKQLLEVQSVLEQEDLRQDAISGWSVYQQIEHVLVAARAMAQLIVSGTEPDEVKPRNLRGYIVLSTGRIPRGRAKSPKQALPDGCDQEQLRQMCVEVGDLYQQITPEMLKKTHVVGNHPYFGGLNPKTWLRMAEVHTEHHLKIVRDIVAAS